MGHLQEVGSVGSDLVFRHLAHDHHQSFGSTRLKNGQTSTYQLETLLDVGGLGVDGIGVEFDFGHLNLEVL